MNLTYLRRLLLAALFLFGFCSLIGGCATSGDLRQLADAQDRFEQRVMDSVQSVQSGASSPDELRDSLKQARDEYRASLEKVASDINSRVEAVAQGGLGLGEAGGLAGLITLVAGVGLNYYRNRTRLTDPAVSNQVARQSQPQV